tara:strand:- start:904 stop:1539 length:636 start_codon:yes stop_codon:yes gene_type:complete
MSFCITLELYVLSACQAIVSALDVIHNFGLASSNYGSLVAALVTAVVIFTIREFFNRAANYSGVFHTKSSATSSAYNPYRNLITFHTLILYSDGYIISGTSEKTGDMTPEACNDFEGVGKSRGVITGRVERNYIRSSVLHLHIIEKGELRDSTIYMLVKIDRYRFFGLIFKRFIPFSGEFYSTAANTKGTVLCGREAFKEHPSKCSRSPSV